MDQKQKMQHLMNNFMKKEQTKQGQVTVKLYVNNEFSQQIQYPTRNQTVNQLVNYLRNLLNQTQIVGFQTLESNIYLDYYLTTNMDLAVLSNLTLSLKPLYGINQNGINLDSFYFLQCIGIGGFSRVYLVRYKFNGQFMALKMISKSFIEQNDKFQIVQNERDIMVHLANTNNSHPNLCKLLCAFETKNWVCFAMEYCPGGELFQQLKRVKKMDEQQAKFYFSQVCMAIHHLHENKVIYRDIKPENILIDSEGHIKLADFGLAKPNVQDNKMAYSFCGSPEYMAPEMLLKSGHNYQIDHYCLGALLYELVTGLPPYYSNNPEQIYQNILSHDLPQPNKNISAEAKDLINKLLQKDTQNRLGRTYGIYEILKHPWLSEFSLYKLINRSYDPPFKPDLFKMNFDQKEILSGEHQFQKELQKSMNTEMENVFTPFFHNFYYSSFQFKQPQRSSSITQINISNVDDKFTNILLSTTKSKHVSQTHQSSSQSQLKKKKLLQNDVENKENLMKNNNNQMIMKAGVKHKKNNQSMPDNVLNVQQNELRSYSSQKVNEQLQKLTNNYQTNLIKSPSTENDEQKQHKLQFGENKQLNKNQSNQCSLIRYFKQ
ncbi:unnamed protein product (macronuclear) [Paramecium tetraurelia]|uniref:Protein kinase domain-containing protein n=1 Tax=Paramecium tetraurelia TaxID=5888 RepID=A0DI25_PARTE|nr:uncharacterized protein GSPATT00017063001 [Paramecium tetraurelia]CAK82692.1 unnamed protein product [Paramecium tetraurelia]|eukprot:XP_001450089.1 hypothetical protein (macronuclear) [Paramecium tetraurelia strain d4-2]